MECSNRVAARRKARMKFFGRSIEALTRLPAVLLGGVNALQKRLLHSIEHSKKETVTLEVRVPLSAGRLVVLVWLGDGFTARMAVPLYSSL
jgi:hypothetical protein